MALKITDIEKQTGMIAVDPATLKTVKTPQDLIDQYGDNPEAYVPVNYTDRVKFLKDNGYEVTRENLINAGLSSTRKKRK